METQGNLESLYQARFAGDEVLAKKNRIWKVLCEHYFQAWVPLNGTVVDVAAGYCEFLNNIRASQKIGFDLNTETARFASSGVRILNASCLTLEGLEDQSVDVFFASNFLEHLNTKDEAVLLFRNMFRKLKAGGKILVLQPNLGLIGAPYWDFLDHKLPWTESSLVELGTSTGLQVACCVKRFLPYTTKSALPQAPIFVRLYLKLLPVSGWALGKQTFVVFQKGPTA